MVYSIFLQVITETSCSFIHSFVTPNQVTKIFGLLFLRLENYIIITSKAYCIAGFLHQCIYTLQDIPGDDDFCLVCIQNQSLTLPLHCNTCYMERYNHENLFLCFLSMSFQFTTDVLPFYWFCCQFSNSCDSTSFQIFSY